jgi:hypothetical protein
MRGVRKHDASVCRMHRYATCPPPPPSVSQVWRGSRWYRRRTFQGHRVVMAVSLRLKNASASRAALADSSCDETSL